MDPAGSWGLTSPAGLNVVVKQPEGAVARVELRSRSGRTFGRFGYQVGQPLASPPRHPEHRDDPELGEIDRPALVWPVDPLYADLTLRLGDDEPTCRLRLASEGSDLQGVVEGGEGQEARVVLEQPERGRFRLDAPEGRDLARPYAFTVSRSPQGPSQPLFGPCSTRAGLLLRGRQFIELAPLLLNLCHDDELGLHAPVCRSWTAMMGRILGVSTEGPLVFNWDSALVAAAVARTHPEIAEALVSSVVSLQQPDGRIAQLRCGRHFSPVSAPPVLAFALEDLVQARPKPAPQLAAWLDALERWLGWFRACRTVGWHPLLLSWGGPTRWLAAIESGMDDSPVWDKATFDDRAGRFETAAVDLSSLVAAAYGAASHLAYVLGDQERRERFSDRAERLSAAIHDTLWCEHAGLYLPRNGDGSFVESVTPTVLYPLLAPVLPSPSRVERLVAVLDDERLLGGHPPIPTLARGDPLYDPDGDYWRGRIWPPVNWLVRRGLARVRPDLATRLAGESRRLYMAEWTAHHHAHENLSGLTGRGEAALGTYARSCPMYTWAILMCL